MSVADCPSHPLLVPLTSLNQGRNRTTNRKSPPRPAICCPRLTRASIAPPTLYAIGGELCPIGPAPGHARRAAARRERQRRLGRTAGGQAVGETAGKRVASAVGIHGRAGKRRRG